MTVSPKPKEMRSLAWLGFGASMVMAGAAWGIMLLSARPETSWLVMLAGSVVGVGVLSTHLMTMMRIRESARAVEHQNARLKTIATRLGKSMKDSRRDYAQAIVALSATVDAKDPYTAGHAERVGELAEATAVAMGLGLYEQNLVKEAAQLHDIGKIGVSDSVLGKTGRLTEEEYEEIRRHPEQGARIVGALRSMAPLVPVIRHHHERWDGKGYPDGLAGEDIPVGARIMAIADTYDAMTSDRPYRRAMLPVEAFDEIKGLAGSQFEPAVVRAFVEAVTPDLPVYSKEIIAVE
jgi:HD-GYP domain-containing protein (c-di-GMP phosphodiesterase class II)